MGRSEKHRRQRRPNSYPRRRRATPITNCPPSIVNSRGFTLIELLVVIAVIGVLMAILLPVLGHVRKQAKAVLCRAHLKQWGMTLALYLEDHDGRFPRPAADSVDCSLSILRGMYIGSKIDPNAAGRYHSVRTEAIACCPMAASGNGLGTFTATANGGVWLEGILGLTYAPWEITKPSPAFRMSYGLNRILFSPLFEGPRSVGVRHQPYTDVFALRGRDGIPLLFDCVQPGATLGLEYEPPPKKEPDGAGGQLCINRHQGCINGLFLDWSVRPIGLKELWTLKWHLQWNTAGPWTRAGDVQPEDWPEWMRGFRDY